MKNRQSKFPGSLVAFCLGCLLSFFAFLTALAQAAPVGQWDCVLSGDEKGVAHLFFNTNFTLEGRAVFTYTGKTTGIFTNKGVTYTNIFGSAQLYGQWSYETPTRTNRIVGFINGVSLQAGTSTFVTNSLSFQGSVAASKVNLSAVGYSGHVTLRCIPLLATNDLRGPYYGTVQKKGAPSPFTEIFTLTPGPELEFITNKIVTSFGCNVTNITTSTNFYSTTNFNFIVNVTNYYNYVVITEHFCNVTNTFFIEIMNNYPANFYAVAGRGPGYEYRGKLLVSRQNYAAFIQQQGPEGEFITVYAGPFNPGTGTGSLLGTDGENRNIRFDISHGP